MARKGKTLERNRISSKSYKNNGMRTKNVIAKINNMPNITDLGYVVTDMKRLITYKAIEVN